MKTGEYRCFDKDSYINCHEGYPLEIGEMKERYERELVELKDPLPQRLLDKVLKGCLESAMLKPKYKKFII